MSSANTFPPPVEMGGMPVEPPVWPKVIGIISIVWGSLGTFCNACSLVMTVGMSSFMQGFMQQMPQAQQDQLKAQFAAQQSPLALGSVALGVIVSAVLLGAGIMTLRRTALGRTLHLVYGLLGLITVGIGIVVAWQVHQAVTAAAGNTPQPPGAQFGMVGGMIFGVCIGGAYPLFSLVWFGAMGKRPEVGAPTSEPLT